MANHQPHFPQGEDAYSLALNEALDSYKSLVLWLDHICREGVVDLDRIDAWRSWALITYSKLTAAQEDLEGDYPYHQVANDIGNILHRAIIWSGDLTSEEAVAAAQDGAVASLDHIASDELIDDINAAYEWSTPELPQVTVAV